MRDVSIKLRITEELLEKIQSFKETELIEQTIVRVLKRGVDVMESQRIEEQAEHI